MKWPKTVRIWQLYLAITRRGNCRRLQDDSLNLEMQNDHGNLGIYGHNFVKNWYAPSFLSGRNPFPNGFIKVSAFKLTVSLHILVIRNVSLSLFHNFLLGCKESWCSNHHFFGLVKSLNLLPAPLMEYLCLRK